MIIVIASVLAAAVVATVGIMRFLAPPSEPPAYTDPAPALAEDGYITHTETVHIDLPREEFHAWVSQPDLELGDLMQGNDDLPQVVGTTPIVGDFDPAGDRTGDRRRVEFEDGHYLAEEVLEDSDETFRYMIWGFTGRQRLFVDHGTAQFEFADEDGGTRLTWTYSLQPTNGMVRPLLQNYVDGALATMMADTAAAMRDGAEAELAG